MPPIFETERIQVEVEDLVKGLEFVKYMYILYYIYYIYNIYIYSSKQIRWFENKNSCICSKTCQIMMAETESLWFKEGNDIRDEFFQAYFAILATADVVTKKCL